jgi:hypothetical protein
MDCQQKSSRNGGFLVKTGERLDARGRESSVWFENMIGIDRNFLRIPISEIKCCSSREKTLYTDSVLKIMEGDTSEK